MKHKKVIGLMAALALAAGISGSTPVYAKSIWDLPGAPERTEESDEEAEEYFRSMEELEAMRESVTEEDTLTEEAQNDLLAMGPGSVYARASGDTPGHWDDSSGYWMYWLDNEGRWATNEWIKQGGDWYYLDGNGRMKSGLFWAADGNAYYCNASGVMQTGWQNLGGVYCWYYFDANGAWLVQSDTKGCSHGVLCLKPNHSHLQPMRIRYYNSAGSAYNSAIYNGRRLWESATDIVSFSEGSSGNHNVKFTLGFYNSYTVAVTYPDGKDVSTVTGDWGSATIDINSNSGTTVMGRDIAHEFGHTFGLSHHQDSRYGYTHSIMYPQSVSTMKIRVYDVNAVGHLQQY